MTGIRPEMKKKLKEGPMCTAGRHRWRATVRGVFLLLALALIPCRSAGAEPIRLDVAPLPASVTYQFFFSHLRADASQDTNVTFADFSLSLTFPRYVTRTGVTATDAPRPTSLGYDVNYVYTALQGWWGFSPDAGAAIGDTHFKFDGASFLFAPSQAPDGYFTRPGAFGGRVLGNAPYAPGGEPFSIEGTGTLLITENPPPIPEPASILLVVTGAGVLWGKYRRRRAP